MVSVVIDNRCNVKHNNFESFTPHLLPYDHITKYMPVVTKRDSAEISDTTAEVSSFGTKHSIGKTGVNFRFYKPG